jgi:Bacterial Ig domain
LKELHLVLLLTTIFFSAIQSNNGSNYTSYAQGQSLQSRDNQAQQPSPSIEPALSVKITSPSNGQNVSTGQLTISGTSSDTNMRECEVYADWNDRKPFQRVVASSAEGNGDYSRWNYTYTTDYHEIVNGTNELTSKISCLASPTNLTKWYSINVTGIEGLISSRNDSSKLSNQDQANNIPNLNNDSSPISTISTAEITASRHGSYAEVEGSESNSDNDNDDVDDIRREDRDEEDEEQNEENEFVIENNQDNEDANNENTELISNENNREEDEEVVTPDDIRREDRDEEDEEQNEENEFVIENNQDNEDANNENTELISNENNREEDEEVVTPENDFDDSDQSENESQESLSEDTDSIERDLEMFGDKGKYEDEDRLGGEESEIHSPFEVPSEVPPLTIPSVPSLPIPDLEDLLQSEDDNCDIDDARFPFCDEQQFVERPIDYDDNCDIDDARFPFCDG